jgi:hypothetical protein
MSTERERFETWAESDELPPDHGGAWRAWRAALSAQAEAHANEVARLKKHAVVLAATTELVERERCAAIAEGFDLCDTRYIAAAIRRTPC